VIAKYRRFGDVKIGDRSHNLNGFVAKITDKQHQINAEMLKRNPIVGIPSIVNITNDGDRIGTTLAQMTTQTADHALSRCNTCSFLILNKDQNRLESLHRRELLAS
jgi:hypothetical protein